MTEREEELLKHALGWPSFYRNYYSTDANDADWRALEAKGWAVSRQSPVSEDTLFHVTPEGRSALLASVLAAPDRLQAAAPGEGQ